MVKAGCCRRITHCAAGRRVPGISPLTARVSLIHLYSFYSPRRRRLSAHMLIALLITLYIVCLMLHHCYPSPFACSRPACDNAIRQFAPAAISDCFIRYRGPVFTIPFRCSAFDICVQIPFAIYCLPSSAFPFCTGQFPLTAFQIRCFRATLPPSAGWALPGGRRAPSAHRTAAHARILARWRRWNHPASGAITSRPPVPAPLPGSQAACWSHRRRHQVAHPHWCRPALAAPGSSSSSSRSPACLSLLCPAPGCLFYSALQAPFPSTFPASTLRTRYSFANHRSSSRFPGSRIAAQHSGSRLP